MGEGRRRWSLFCRAVSFCQKNVLMYHMYNFKHFFKSGEGKNWRGKGRENETEEGKEEVSSPLFCLSIQPNFPQPECSPTHFPVLRSREKSGADPALKEPTAWWGVGCPGWGILTLYGGAPREKCQRLLWEDGGFLECARDPA